MNLYALLAALLVAGAAVGGAYYQGRQDGGNACEAAAARDERVAQVASAAAASAAANAISGIKVRHSTIKQEVEREIQTRVEYRDCRHSGDGMQRINAALADGAASQPAGRGFVPRPDAFGR